MPEFDCKWCSELNKCSTGTSRQRQEWLLKGCDVRNVKELNNCPAQITTYRGDQYDHDGHVHPEESIATNEMGMKQERSGNSSLESSGGVSSFNIRYGIESLIDKTQEVLMHVDKVAPNFI